MGKPGHHHLILLRFIWLSCLSIGQNKVYAQGTTTSNKSRNTTSSIDVGVILDTKTWLGNISWSCMSMAMEDFYNSHSNFTKRLSLHLQDVNKDDRIASASAAIDLLKNVQVQAIIGPQTSRQAKFVIELGKRLLKFQSSLSLLLRALLFQQKRRTSWTSMDHRQPIVMQGVLGIKPYVSENNRRLQDFKARFVKKFKLENPSSFLTNYTFLMNNVRKNSTDLESIGKSQTGLELVQWISNTTFDGVGGKFQLIDGQLETNNFEIVNVVGNGRHRIGFWTPANGFSMELNAKKDVKAEVINWPGTNSAHVPPRGWEWPTNGRNLSVGIPVKSGFCEFVNVTVNDSSIRPTGYSIEIFDKVMAALPYKVNDTYEYFVNEKGEMSGSYDDLIYQVYLKRYDAVVGDITVIANRSQYVDFTVPYTESGVSMVVPVMDRRRKNAWTFAEPLSTSLWIASGVFFIFTGIVVWILEHRVNLEFRGPPSNQIGTIFYFTFSTLVFAHRGSMMNNISRIVLIIWLFVVLILQQSYTASLSSILTVEQRQPTLTDFSELIRSKSKVGYMVGSFVLRLLKGSNFDESRLIPYKTSDEYEEGLSSGTVAAIIDEIPYLKAFLHNHCGKYTMVGPIYKTNGFGFAFPIGSPMVVDISRAILNITEKKEKMEDLDQHYLYDDVEACSVEEDGSSSSMITFKSFWGLFLITGVISMLAFLIHISMFFYQNWSIVRDADPELSFGQRLLLLMRHHDRPDLQCADAFKEKKEEEMVALEMQSSVSASYNGHDDHVVGNVDDDDDDDDDFYVGVPLGEFGSRCNLHYADDLLVLTTGGLEDLRIVKLILFMFEGITSLATNFSKTCLYSSDLGKLPEVDVTDTLSCERGLLPVTYLGIPISRRRPRKQDWEGLISKIRKRLASWKVRHVSLGVDSHWLTRFLLRYLRTGCPCFGYPGGSSRKLTSKTCFFARNDCMFNANMVSVHALILKIDRILLSWFSTFNEKSRAKMEEHSTTIRRSLEFLSSTGDE
ncbi:glutamate receptor 2.7-like [Dioscorea cayenensis subsp. rotundata]|uniref:Glutamate receptor 2.7-like n=1 Tax=Dioscorea cayennensis subsp. rotundata TaxID=55577 RepID=A0AB40AMZ9_DIOCR|nr:glutamate receptor 2.7-like [Dioscorea cayenensis subsp. rotundata]